MHTYKGINGTVFRYNSDWSGRVEIQDGERYEVHVDASDLLQFLTSVRGEPDRERIEFVRRAALHMLATDPSRPKWQTREDADAALDLAITQARALWMALRVEELTGPTETQR